MLQNDYVSAEQFCLLARTSAKETGTACLASALAVSSDVALSANKVEAALAFASEYMKMTEKNSDIFSRSEIESAKQKLAKVLVAHKDFELALSLISSIKYGELNSLLEESSRITTESFETKLEIALNAKNYQEARKYAIAGAGWSRNAEKVLREKPLRIG